MANKKRLDNIDVMGSNYKIYYRTENEDPALTDCMGYCDKYQKLLVIDDTDSDKIRNIFLKGVVDMVGEYERFTSKLGENNLFNQKIFLRNIDCLFYCL